MGNHDALVAAQINRNECMLKIENLEAAAKNDKMTEQLKAEMKKHQNNEIALEEATRSLYLEKQEWARLQADYESQLQAVLKEREQEHKKKEENKNKKEELDKDAKNDLKDLMIHKHFIPAKGGFTEHAKAMKNLRENYKDKSCLPTFEAEQISARLQLEQQRLTVANANK